MGETSRVTPLGSTDNQTHRPPNLLLQTSPRGQVSSMRQNYPPQRRHIRSGRRSVWNVAATETKMEDGEGCTLLRSTSIPIPSSTHRQVLSEACTRRCHAVPKHTMRRGHIPPGVDDGVGWSIGSRSEKYMGRKETTYIRGRTSSKNMGLK